MPSEAVTDTHVLGVPIEYGPVPQDLPNPELRAESVQAQGTTVIVSVGGARMLVQDGSRVVIDAGTIRRRQDLQWLAYGWAAQVLKIQRHRFCLHASSIAADGRAYAITGRSGAGKSTTSYALIRDGWTPLVDDVSEIDPGPPMRIVPYQRPIQLTADSMQRWQEPGSQTTGPTPRGKWVLPGGQGTDPVPLGAVIVIAVDEGLRGTPVTRKLPALEAFAMLKGFSRLQGISELPAHREAYLDWLQQMSRAAVFQITRPTDHETLAEVMAAVRGIQEDVKGRGDG